MYVFAFDRDWTVDVNPHPDREAVPLSWVRHLAHETDHAVYAIGNQRLAEEAAVPGVVDVVGRHPDDWETWLGDKEPTGRYERFPSRRERLRLVADLHPEAEAYVVVDDRDLGDVEGWTHYHAWEFVPAVERGAVDPSLPWTREATDGGRSVGGVVPTDPDHLASFLEAHADAPAYEVTWERDGERTTRLVAAMERPDRPAAHPVDGGTTFVCTPLPVGERFRVRFEDVERVAVADPPGECFRATGEDAAERAANLRDLASACPERAPVDDLLELARGDDEGARRDAVAALRAVDPARLAEADGGVATLVAVADRAEGAAATNAVAALADVADERPDAVDAALDAVRAHLVGDDDARRREAARCLAGVASHDAGAAIDTVPGLAAVLSDRAAGHAQAAYALNRVADEYPTQVRPVVPALREAAGDADLSDCARVNATGALGRVVSAFPGAGVGEVDAVAPLLDADHPKLRNNAVGLLGDVATVHADVVEPHVLAVADLLTVDDRHTRANAAAALARVAADYPATVRGATDRLVARLDDDHPVVRENACWAVGHLAAESARERLERLRAEDEAADVRERAAWALERLDG